MMKQIKILLQIDVKGYVTTESDDAIPAGAKMY